MKGVLGLCEGCVKGVLGVWRGCLGLFEEHVLGALRHKSSKGVCEGSTRGKLWCNKLLMIEETSKAGALSGLRVIKKVI